MLHTKPKEMKREREKKFVGNKVWRIYLFAINFFFLEMLKVPTKGLRQYIVNNLAQCYSSSGNSIEWVQNSATSVIHASDDLCKLHCVADVAITPFLQHYPPFRYHFTLIVCIVKFYFVLFWFALFS